MRKRRDTRPIEPRLGVWWSLALLVLMGGCSSQDFGRPITGAVTDLMDAGDAYVDTTDDPDGSRRAEQLARALAVWEQQRGSGDAEYELGPEDILVISILSLETPEKTSVLKRTVRRDGTITMPLIDPLPVAGLTVAGVYNSVVNAYKDKFLRDPQVDVSIAEYRSAPVVVTGAVQRPGIYYLRSRTSTVLEVLSLADGLSPAAGTDLLIVRSKPGAIAVPVTNAVPDVEEVPADSEADDTAVVNAAIAAMALDDDTAADDDGDGSADRFEGNASVVEDEAPQVAEADTQDAAAEASGSELITVDLERLLDRGDVRLNLRIRGGDIVTVPPGRQEYVYVLGYVQRPGAFELRGRKRVRAMQAVALAGGLSGSARAQNSYLIIDRPTGRQVVSVDLTKIARGVRPPVYMEAGHTLVIGSGTIAKLAEFIKPSIGASASLTPGL